jgi:hypothetical protein
MIMGNITVRFARIKGTQIILFIAARCVRITGSLLILDA